MPDINGCPLPAGLLALLGAGRWRRPDDVDRVRAATGLSDADDLLFCDLESMRDNTSLGLDVVGQGAWLPAPARATRITFPAR